MAGNEFQQGVNPTAHAVDIPPLDNGAATEAVSSNAARAISAGGAIAEEAAKTFLKVRAYREAKGTDVLGMAMQKHGVDAVEQEYNLHGQDAPHPVKNAVKTIKTLKERIRQEGAVQGTFAAVDAAVREVSSTAPGWADEIYKFASDELGYDPGGLREKMAMQKEMQAYQAQLTLTNDMITLGIDPQEPDAHEKYLTRKRLNADTQLSAQQAEIMYRDMQILKMQAEMGQISKDAADKRMETISLDWAVNQSRMMNDSIGTLVGEGQKRYAGIFDTDGGIRQEITVKDENGNSQTIMGTEALKAWRTDARQQITNMRHNVNAVRTQMVALNLKDAQINQLLNPAENQLKTLESLVDGASTEKATKELLDLRVNQGLVDIGSREPSIYAAVGLGRNGLADTFATSALKTKTSNAVLNWLQEGRAAAPIRLGDRTSQSDISDRRANDWRQMSERYDPNKTLDSQYVKDASSLVRHMSAPDIGAADWQQAPAELKDATFGAVSSLLAHNSDPLHASVEYKQTMKALQDNDAFRTEYANWIATRPAIERSAIINGLQKSSENAADIAGGQLEQTLENLTGRVTGQFGTDRIFKIDTTGNLAPSDEVAGIKPTIGARLFSGATHGADYNSLRRATDLVNPALAGPVTFQSLGNDIPKNQLDALSFTQKAVVLGQRGMGRITVTPEGMPLQFTLDEGSKYLSGVQGFDSNQSGKVKMGLNIYYYDSKQRELQFVRRLPAGGSQ